jgi:hypothetical protein
MPDFRRLPLSQLIHYCPSLLQVTSAETRSAWVELYRRALVEQNQAAWDALMIRLWPSLLYWIYARAPEISPATAERVAQRAIRELKRQSTTLFHRTSSLPDYEQLLTDLQRLVERLLAE